MLQITQLKLPYHHTEEELQLKIRKTLKLSKEDRFTYTIAKKSIDARKKPELYLVYSCMVTCQKEANVAKRAKSPSVSIVSPKQYQYPAPGEQELTHRPLIIGAGPAGLFAAWVEMKPGNRFAGTSLGHPTRASPLQE
jgi:uncharacterized FAD-dependent dehydrogenase